MKQGGYTRKGSQQQLFKEVTTEEMFGVPARKMLYAFNVNPLKNSKAEVIDVQGVDKLWDVPVCGSLLDGMT